MPIAVRCHPRAVINKLRCRNQGTRRFKRHACQSINFPTRKCGISHVGIDKVEMIGIVQRHVAFITKLMLLEAERR